MQVHLLLLMLLGMELLLLVLQSLLMQQLLMPLLLVKVLLMKVLLMKVLRMLLLKVVMLLLPIVVVLVMCLLGNGVHPVKRGHTRGCGSGGGQSRRAARKVASGVCILSTVCKVVGVQILKGCARTRRQQDERMGKQGGGTVRVAIYALHVVRGRSAGPRQLGSRTTPCSSSGRAEDAACGLETENAALTARLSKPASAAAAWGPLTNGTG